jgi:hypothetical protein
MLFNKTMKIDLHFHFRARKKDRMDWLKSMIKKADSIGIEGIALLDHNYFPEDSIINEARLTCPNITFWRACELDIRDNKSKMKNHVVVLSEDALPFDYSKGVSLEDLHLLTEYSKREDVLTMLAHPFRHNQEICFDLSAFHPDLIDSVGRTANQHYLKEVVRLAAKWDMGLASASDSHRSSHTGHHWIELKDKVKTIAQLKTMTKQGQYRLASR